MSIADGDDDDEGEDGHSDHDDSDDAGDPDIVIMAICCSNGNIYADGDDARITADTDAKGVDVDDGIDADAAVATGGADAICTAFAGGDGADADDEPGAAWT